MGRILFVLSALIFLFPISPAYAIPAGLVHHWNFDEGPDWHDDAFQTVSQATTAYDSVGTADADLQNMDAADWVSGRQFTCLDFDGANDYLYTSTNLSLTLGNTSSLAFWIRTTQTGGTTGGDAPGVIGTEVASGGNDIQWGWLDSSGKIALSVDDTVIVRSADPINDGNWHHIAFTRNAGTGAGQVYVDGELSDSATGATGAKTTAFHSIGRIEDTGGTPRYFQGRLDQIHVFNQVIDQAMVQQIMNNHAPKTWNSTTQGTNDATFSTESILLKSYDPEQDTLSVLSYTQPTHGSAVHNGDGTFNYTADTGYTGTDSFVTIVDDGKGGLHQTTMNVIVLNPALPDAANRTTTFINFQALQAGGIDISLNGWRVPRAFDWDGDSDNDLLIGHGGFVWLYINSGSPSSPSFNAGTKVQSNGSDINLSSSAITLADMTGDSVLDLVVCDSSEILRVYENSSLTGQVPVYAAASIIKTPGGSNFVLPDQRFDIGDWDGDSLPDIVMGTRQSEVRAYINVGSASDPRFDTAQYEVLMSGAYNLYPRLFDISRNGVLDLLRGINWGSITYWFDPLLHDDLGPSGNLVITDTLGASPDLHALTDGAMVDFGDYNNDGVLDLLVGGHANSKVYIAYGLKKTVADCITQNEAIYDAHPGDLGDALEANSQELLGQINDNSRAIISHMLAATLPERQVIFTQMTTHVSSYSFLQMNAPINTTVYHHVPSIAGQNLMTMHQMLPDTPSHRLNVANAVGLTGLHREIYLNMGLHVGDNQNATQGQLESIRDFMSYQPRESFPDAVLTLDHYYGDGRGGMVNSFRGAKNTFNFGEGSNVAEWDSDLSAAIINFYGSNVHAGDYFTFVMGHEVTHSLDGYVSGRANKNLWRLKGQMLTYAAGPDVLTSNNDDYDWWNWDATKARFQAQGYWDGDGATWDLAWDDYWSTGPGSAFNEVSFMRINIKFFLSAPQEALATQANHHWGHGEARLIGAIDRWRRGGELGIEPMRANVNEVVLFLDYISVGLNKVVMQDTTGVSSPYPHAEYNNTHAWLERNDNGYITKVTVNDNVYKFTVDEHGMVTSVATNIFTVADDSVTAYSNTNNVIDVLANDHTLEGGPLSIAGFTQPAHGTVTDNGNDTLTYRPDPGHTGSDSFTYDASSAAGTASATVNIQVLNSINDNLMTHLTMDTSDISGSTITDVSGPPSYNGTIVDSSGNPTGQINEALTLDGINDNVTIPAMNLNSNTVTISAWVWRDEDQKDWAGIIFKRDGSACGINVGTNNELRYHWNDASNTWGWNSGLTLPNQDWSHIGLVIEPDKATIYLNGASTTNNVSHSVNSFANTTRIGMDNSGREFKGRIDDVAIWNRALAANEFQNIYNLGLSGKSFGFVVITGDLDSDGDVDLVDLSILKSEYLLQESHMESAGLVVIEAEHFTENTPGSGSMAGSDWTQMADSGSIGDGFMQALPDQGRSINSSLETYSPHLSYPIYFSTTGDYYLWVRGMATDSNADTVHYGADGTAFSFDYNSALAFPIYSSFLWSSQLGSGARPMISIDSPGMYSLDLWMREDGTALDRFALTTDVNYNPSSGGEPTESVYQNLTYDLNADGIMNLADYTRFANAWLEAVH